VMQINVIGCFRGNLFYESIEQIHASVFCVTTQDQVPSLIQTLSAKLPVSRACP
jgi:hypothetical protein